MVGIQSGTLLGLMNPRLKALRYSGQKYFTLSVFKLSRIILGCINVVCWHLGTHVYFVPHMMCGSSPKSLRPLSVLHIGIAEFSPFFCCHFQMLSQLTMHTQERRDLYKYIRMHVCIVLWALLVMLHLCCLTPQQFYSVLELFRSNIWGCWLEDSGD